ncbi:MAG: FG-GAP-like repeat-containing protein [Pyrinomonadaceae bacterium]
MYSRQIFKKAGTLLTAVAGLAAVIFAGMAGVAAAQSAGAFDPSFGTGGKVYAVPANFMPAQDVAVQADGKIVLVGSSTGPDGTSDFGVVRLNANGSVDTSFGTGGLIRFAFDTGASESATAVAITSGIIFVAGNVEFGAASWDIGVIKLLANGTVDASYNGGAGKAKIDMGGEEFVNDIAIQTDDKLVLTGTTRSTPNTDVAVIRLNYSGTLDTTFNGTGKIFIGIGSGNNDGGTGLALQPDGKIVVAGYTREQSRGYFLAVRLTTGGVPDFSFSSLGFRQTAVGTQFDRANAVAVQADGKIVLAGTTNSGSGDESAFVRYNTDGTLDNSFDGDGKLVVDVRPGNSEAMRSVVVQADQKIVGVGAGGGAYILVRLNASGALDTQFGTGGKVAAQVSPGPSGANRGILQPDGKILAVGDGSDNSGGFGYTAARFLTRPLAQNQFDIDGDGKDDIGVYRPGPREWWFIRSSTGAVGVESWGIGGVIAPADYTGDGKMDLGAVNVAAGVYGYRRSENYGQFLVFVPNSGNTKPVPADYDGDGHADIAVVNDSRSWYVIPSGTGAAYTRLFGAADDIATPADFDGDRIADVSIFRPSSGEWWIDRSAAGLIVITFGASGDRAVAADYTGDGKADIAVYRPSSGVWYILRSEDLSYYAFPFGISTDIPVPADYDGDGRIDPAVYRPSTFTWYILKSTGGLTVQTFGTSGDVPAAGYRQ